MPASFLTLANATVASSLRAAVAAAVARPAPCSCPPRPASARASRREDRHRARRGHLARPAAAPAPGGACGGAGRRRLRVDAAVKTSPAVARTRTTCCRVEVCSFDDRLQVLQIDVPVPDRAALALQGQHALKRPPHRVVIGRDRDHVAVEDVHQRVAAGDDLDLIPFARRGPGWGACTGRGCPPRGR